tara:strand:+ start:1525 stop:1629 length:105 start_codon:yes stop_codon:yes gene_type:complete
MISFDMLKSSEEVFVTSASSGIIPIIKIDGERLF